MTKIPKTRQYEKNTTELFSIGHLQLGIGHTLKCA